jgi:hypothetical protein
LRVNFTLGLNFAWYSDDIDWTNVRTGDGRETDGSQTTPIADRKARHVLKRRKRPAEAKAMNAPSPAKSLLPGSPDRSVRSLIALQESASTARTLNLIAVWQKYADSAEYKASPFFQSAVLNRSIIVKHRLRQHERDCFDETRTSATKVILPIDITNLKSGARSFFVGQRGFRDLLWDFADLSTDAGRRDHDLLLVLDTLPSLDPFLMRERLKRAGYTPARPYFEITGADTARMFQFVRKEVSPLIGMSYTQLDAHLSEKTAKLASIILANSVESELEPLRQGLGMDKAAFEEGMFCWKGFIYYKWTLGDLAPKVKPVSAEIARVAPSGTVDLDDEIYIVAARERLVKAIGAACANVRATLKIYDDAYADLTRNGAPQAFREFLLRSPSLFQELGERLGGVQHITSFWSYRCPPGSEPDFTAEELVDLLADFEGSIGSGGLDIQAPVSFSGR